MSNRHVRQQLRLERLEEKTLLAADFASELFAEVIDGDLFVTNINPAANINSSAQSIILEGAGPGEIRVAPASDVTVNGVEVGDSVTLSGFTGDVIVDFGSVPVAAGETATFNLLVGELDVPGDLVLSADIDGLAINLDGETDTGVSTIGGDLIVNSASGILGGTIGFVDVGDDIIINASQADDISELIIAELTIGDDLRVFLGDGDSGLTVGAAEIGDDIIVSSGDGSDEVTLSEVIVGDDISVLMGDGDGIVTIDTASEVGDDVRVTTGGGDDEVLLSELEIGDDLRVSLGDGDDNLADAADIVVGDTTFISLGDGEDDASIEGFEGDSFVLVGRGVNAVELVSFEVAKSITIFTCSGEDEIAMEEVTTPYALIVTGGGEDVVDLFESTFDHLIVLLGSGDDELVINGLTIDAWAIFSGGSGDDTLEDVDGSLEANLIIDFAFETIEVDEDLD